MLPQNDPISPEEFYLGLHKIVNSRNFLVTLKKFSVASSFFEYFKKSDVSENLGVIPEFQSPSYQGNRFIFPQWYIVLYHPFWIAGRQVWAYFSGLIRREKNPNFFERQVLKIFLPGKKPDVKCKDLGVELGFFPTLRKINSKKFSGMQIGISVCHFEI